MNDRKSDKKKSKKRAPTTTSVQVAPSVTPVTAASSRNIGMNIAGCAYYSSQVPFTDAFKTASAWVFNGDWGHSNAHEFPLDPHGYPTQILPGQKAETLVMRALRGHYPAGKYVVTYEGSGTVDMVQFDVSSSVKTQPGRIEVMANPGDAGLVLSISESKLGDHIRNIRIWLPDLENSSSEFNPRFMNLLKPFETIRFMDFQATNGNPLTRWADRPLPSDATYTRDVGVPIETMINLANAARMNPWFCIPHLADEDFIRRFAEMVKSTLDPSLKVYIEYSNEVWNGQFLQAQYARQQGLSLRLSDNEFQAQLRFYSQKSVEVFKIWKQVFEQSPRLICVMGSQAVNSWVSQEALSWKDAKDYTNALAIAPYFGFDINADTTKLTVDELIGKMQHSIDNENRQWIRSQSSVAKEYNVKLVAYEGGQHLVGTFGQENNDELTALLIAANRHPGMYNLYKSHLDNWFAEGGDLYAIFSFIGLPSKWGSWGVLEYADQPLAEAHKYRAVAEYRSNR